MKIYTKTGDAGTTGLFGGPRVAKDDPRICAYGSVDELNAVIGIARSTGLGEKLDGILSAIQHHLFSISNSSCGISLDEITRSICILVSLVANSSINLVIS